MRQRYLLQQREKILMSSKVDQLPLAVALAFYTLEGAGHICEAYSKQERHSGVWLLSPSQCQYQVQQRAITIPPSHHTNPACKQLIGDT